MKATNTPLVAVELFFASVWVGSLVCLAVVAGVARKVLDDRSQVMFFRAVGRRYGIVGTGSLLVAIGAGLALAWPPTSWSTAMGAAVALAGALVLASAAGMVQAHHMTGLRQRAAARPDDQGAANAVHRGRAMAGATRGLMALLTLAILILVAQVISQ